MNETTDTPPDQSTETFVSYLINQVLADPRTKAQIGSAIRSTLVALGSGWAATHGDALNIVVGVLIAVASAAWGLYQKFRVDRKIRVLKAAAIPAEPPLPPTEEAKKDTAP